MPPSKAKAHLARARAAKLTKKLQKQHDGPEFPSTENPGTDCQNAALPVVPVIRESSPEGKQNLAASSTQETPDVDVPADEAVSSYALIDLSSLDKIVTPQHPKLLKTAITMMLIDGW
ncbi:uncharacterized protein LOC131950131 isoform X2 [Physella acuta]|uniref:uncharacterized protein LOC131950131 isoform X2 n=1 Tax=Physella acuta TaxID=109671 RepID=UPI0027DB56ED|nr:uncharacterized protein LOC131950131 isoform X2 [Physella acuta]